MRGADVRDSFIAYFAAREHRVVRSSPLVPVGDPTLLFTNAGMNQFKDVFTGREARDYRRAVSSQKCLRVSGKHNDLEQVGRTPRHHTFFEMLGNFSFGDYFKEEAVRLAWDLITHEWGVPKERLTATVFGGEEGLPPDTEAEDLWRRLAGLPADRVLRFGARDNFWRMGDTGPCGPCSELHYDQGPERGCGRADCAGPACECDRFLEIWNLVFMQFDQQETGGLRPLPKPSIDTGMGLERITAVLQGRASNYETDLFTPLLTAIGAAVGRAPDEGGPTRVSMQVIADHLRAISFLIADGVVPGNEGRGYVLRRILRRAFRHGRLLGQQGPFLHRLTGVVVDSMGPAYPELETARAALDEVCRAEEERFEDTLAESLRRLEESFERHAASRRLPGDELFRLYDTFGMPLDFAEELARDKGFALDMEGYAAALEAQRTRARESWKGGGGGPATAVFDALRARGVQTAFLGYETEFAAARVLGLARGETEVESVEAAGVDGGEAHVVLDQTPLYAEAGGQVGEQGRLEWDGGQAEVLDSSSPAAGLIAHRVRLVEGRLAVGAEVRVRSLAEDRRATRRNHTATHLLHAALKSILGPHVKQAGSLVAPDRLRFDFTHWRPLSPARVREIEDLVNARILDNLPTETRTLPLDEAIATGAVALFGEKYAPRVRVVTVPGFSSELCGGLHCAATGDIGLFKIVGERGIAAGIRRLEALTGRAALVRFQEDEDRLAAAAHGLGVSRDELAAGAERVQRRVRDLQQEVERLRMKLAGGGGSGGAGEIRQVDGLSVLTRRVEDLDRTQMRQLADNLKARADVVVLGMAAGDRVSLLVAVREAAAGRVPARAIADRLAQLVDGRGGGKATLAEAGGRDPARLDEALRQGSGVVRALLGLPSGEGA